jgi:hypothetical protein
MKIKKMSTCAEIWDSVFNLSPKTTPFVSYEWFSALANNILNYDPDVITFWHNSKPVGVMPAKIDGNTLQFIGDERITDLADIICLSGFEDLVLEDLTEYINVHDLLINLFPLEKNSLLSRCLPDLLNGITIDESDVCPFLTLPETWEAYQHQLSGKLRHELRRKMKKGQHIEIHKCGPDSIDIFFNLMSDSDVKKAMFLTQAIKGFLSDVAELFFRKNFLRLRIGVLDSLPAGALLSFQNENTVFLYNSGFNPAHKPISPGIAMIGLDIRDAITENKHCYDFLRGDEEYKMRFGAEKRKTLRLRR